MSMNPRMLWSLTKASMEVSARPGGGVTATMYPAARKRNSDNRLARLGLARSELAVDVVAEVGVREAGP